MDKQPKLIDAEKVFDWANDNISDVDFARLHQAFKNGEFDPIPPTIKPGDKVILPGSEIEGTVVSVDCACVQFYTSDGTSIEVYPKLSDLEVSHD